MNFYSEYAEDSFLFHRFPEFFSKPQFYVDVGCADPIVGSNTAFLRDLGWQGLHIDADPDWNRLWNGRMINAVIHTEPEVKFFQNPVHCLSRIGDGDVVSTRRLDDILFEYQVDKIGLLSIDCEGAEIDVVNSLENFRHWPPFIISEYNTYGIGEDYSVCNLLSKKGYQVIFQTIANMVYYDESRRID